jgi:pantoate--beta-alanine ligase
LKCACREKNEKEVDDHEFSGKSRLTWKGDSRPKPAKSLLSAKEYIMREIASLSVMQETSLQWLREGRSVGLVPTMGYLHEGHLSLIRWARERCDMLVVSVFLNPAQFGPNEDLDTYPVDFARDSALSRECGTDVLFCPDRSAMYEPGHGTWVETPELTKILCGRSRPVFFRGIATVVTKLFQLVRPTFAVFGEKDWQQLAVIRKMVRELNMPIRIEGRPTTREADGLAMSSRNVYLTVQERAVAPHLHKGLCLLEEMVHSGERNTHRLRRAVLDYYEAHLPQGDLDYLEIVDPHRIEPLEEISSEALAAVAMRLGKARLIDNKYIKI